MVRKILRITAVLAALAALVAGGRLLVTSKMARLAAAPRPTERPTPVRTAVAEAGTLAETRTYLATVVPWQTAELSAQVTARVVDVAVREGDPIRAGEPLVTLDGEAVRRDREELEATILQARAEVAAQEARAKALARSARYWEGEVEREETLLRGGVVAQAGADAKADRLSAVRGEAEAARRSLEAARRQVLSLEKRRAGVDARIDWTRIDAPFDGLVTRRAADPGDLAAPGRALLVVEDRTRVKLAFGVPQADAERVAVGAAVRLGAPAAGDLRPLAVTRVYPSLNADRSLSLEVDVPAEAALKPGTWLPIELELAPAGASTPGGAQPAGATVLVPEDALVDTPDGGHAVFVVAEGVTRAVPVQLRLVRGGRAAVAGLAPGTAVVRSTYLGWNRLAGGERVEVVP